MGNDAGSGREAVGETCFVEMPQQSPAAAYG
jgi:hypothetical protein